VIDSSAYVSYTLLMQKREIDSSRWRFFGYTMDTSSI